MLGQAEFAVVMPRSCNRGSSASATTRLGDTGPHEFFLVAHIYIYIHIHVSIYIYIYIMRIIYIELNIMCISTRCSYKRRPHRLRL